MKDGSIRRSNYTAPSIDKSLLYHFLNGNTQERLQDTTPDEGVLPRAVIPLIRSQPDDGTGTRRQIWYTFLSPKVTTKLLVSLRYPVRMANNGDALRL